MPKKQRKSIPIATNGWGQLQALLGDEDQHTSPGISLVLGAGIHKERHPTSIATSVAVNALGSWYGLLSHFATSQSLELDIRGGNLALTWEELAFKCSQKGEAGNREKFALQKLRKVIEQFRSDLPQLSPRANLVIRDLRFLNIVNLNIDPFLVQELRSFAVQRAARTSISTLPKIYRHSRRHRNQSTNQTIWQPHGDTDSIDSLQLGSRSYMRSVMMFEKYRNKISEVNRSVVAPKKRQSTSYKSWADVMMHSHLVFVGCGLSLHDADMWFALNCRRRYWIRDPDKTPKTFVVRVDEKNADSIPQEYATVLSANNYDDAWKLLGWALEVRKGGK